MFLYLNDNEQPQPEIEILRQMPLAVIVKTILYQLTPQQPKLGQQAGYKQRLDIRVST